MRELEGRFSKIIGLLLALVLILSGVFMLSTTYAEEIENVSVANYTYISEDTAKLIVETWSTNFYEESATVEKIEKVYNVDDTFYGYKVEFSYLEYYDSIVITDTADTQLIINTFTVFTPREEYFNKTLTKQHKFSKSSKLYLVEPYKIAEEIAPDTLHFNDDHVINKSKVECKNFSKQAVLRSPPINGTTITDEFTGTIKKEYLLKGITEYYHPERQVYFSREGNCGPTAVLNVLKYWTTIGYDLYDLNKAHVAYDAIIKHIGKEKDVNILEMQNGLKKFVKATNKYKASTFTYWGAFWGYYKSDLEKDRPVIHCINTIENGEKTGHAMVALGYLETTTGKFLKIGSGWEYYIQYINFDAFSSKTGTYCTIK